MIAYFEEFLGLQSGELETPFGIALCMIMLVVFGVSIFRTVFSWLSMFFGGK